MTPVKVLGAWKKTGLGKMMDPKIQMEAVKLHAEGRLFKEGHTEVQGQPDAFDEPESTEVRVRLAPAFFFSVSHTSHSCSFLAHRSLRRTGSAHSSATFGSA